MRTLLLIPIVIVAVAAAGFAACAGFGWQPHPREMMLAGVTSLCAAALAAVPLILTRGSSQLVVVQAALVGTIVHLFASLAAAVVIVLGRIAPAQPFVGWLLLMYWSTLVVLVVAFTRILRAAPPASSTAPRPPAPAPDAVTPPVQ